MDIAGFIKISQSAPTVAAMLEVMKASYGIPGAMYVLHEGTYYFNNGMDKSGKRLELFNGVNVLSTLRAVALLKEEEALAAGNKLAKVKKAWKLDGRLLAVGAVIEYLEGEGKVAVAYDWSWKGTTGKNIVVVDAAEFKAHANIYPGV